MENYIIRIYRQAKNNPRLLVGVVEHVGSEGKKAFTNLHELWEILNPEAGRDALHGKEIYHEDPKTRSKIP